MTAVLGWVIFVAGLLAVSAAIVVPALFGVRIIFPNWKPSSRTVGGLTAVGAVALWFVIPAAIHAAFGGG